jgi:formylglycine-generating enzyme required for sulfatase activity
LGGPAWSTVAVSPSGRAYFSILGGDQAGSNSDFGMMFTDHPTITPWSGGGAKPDMIATIEGLVARAETPQFAFGAAGGQDAVYATYVAGSLSVPGIPQRPPVGRFGTLVAGAWTFEPLPDVPIWLTSDASGSALVLVQDGILRHLGKGRWESVCLPDPSAGRPVAAAVDTNGAYYVARIDSGGVVHVSRRDSDGSWKTEAVTSGTIPAVHATVAVGGGTVHVVYSAGQGDLHYARRVGTNWVSHTIAGSLPDAFFNPFYLAVDSCGKPHLVTHTGYGGIDMASHYFRWTQPGWRGTRLVNQCDPNASGGLALTPTHAFFSYWQCGVFLGAVPVNGASSGAGGSGNGGSGGMGGGTGGSSSGGAGGSNGNTACRTTVTPPPSCTGLSRTCGADGSDDCCASPCIPGGAFDRRYVERYGHPFEAKTYPVTQSPLHLDKYEVTVGRFRRFAAALAGGYRPSQGAGKHAHLNGGRGVTTVPMPDGSIAYESGWDTAWNGQLPSSWTAPQSDPDPSSSPGTYSTWTPSAGANENLPINFVNFYQAYAFCIWDGGFLPTDAEAYGAAAGGSDARIIPWWSPDAGSTTADASYVVYIDYQPRNVGSRPTGQGRWGHMDVAGNVSEWNLDAFSGTSPLPAAPCTDCAFAPQAPVGRGILGGDYFDYSLHALLTVLRDFGAPDARGSTIGVRCARP